MHIQTELIVQFVLNGKILTHIAIQYTQFNHLQYKGMDSFSDKCLYSISSIVVLAFYIMHCILLMLNIISCIGKYSIEQAMHQMCRYVFVCWSSLVDIVFNFRSRNSATSSSTKRRCFTASETRRHICISIQSSSSHDLVFLAYIIVWQSSTLHAAFPHIVSKKRKTFENVAKKTQTN